MTQATIHPLFDKHIATLRKAVAAAEGRTPWSHYPEAVGERGEDALSAGRAAFDAYRDASFYLDQPGVIGRVGVERSPYGLPLNISYPQCNANTLIVAASGAMASWANAGPDTRTGVCLEILDRLYGYGIELAHAVMHTTGQPFSFAYRHSLVGGLMRGIEAVAMAYREMKQVPGQTRQEVPQGKQPAISIERTYRIAPRGVALAIGSASDPTWSAWPGMFASLATGNPVIVQAHPAATLPLAMTVAVARQTLKEAGFDPNLFSLLADDLGSSSATIVGLRSEVRIIDCAGETDTANWLEENAHQAAIFALKNGINCVVVDSVVDYKGMLRNLAVSLCRNSGQLATAPRLILVAREGIRGAGGAITVDQFGRDLAFAVGKLVEDPQRAVEVLGALQSAALFDEIAARRDRLDDGEGAVLRDSYRINHPQWPDALVVTPLLLKQALGDDNRFLDDVRGPVTFVASAGTTVEALASAERVMRDKGALNFSVYTDSVPLRQMAEDIAARIGVALNLNLTGNLLPSQADAFVDFYATGENPAATCSLVDAAFVARRFYVVQTRTQTA